MALSRQIGLTDGFTPGATRIQALLEDVAPLTAHVRTPYARLAVDSAGDITTTMGHGADTAARMDSADLRVTSGGD